MSDAQLSRAIGHGDSYINQYHRRGSPATLPDRERKAVAKTLKLDEAALTSDVSASVAATATARQAIMVRSGRHIPAFHEGRVLDFEHITDWVERPDMVALSENSFLGYGSTMTMVVLRPETWHSSPAAARPEWAMSWSR